MSMINFLKKPIILSILSALLLSSPWIGGPDLLILIGFVPLLFLQSELHKNSRKGFLWWVSLTLTLWIALTCYWVSLATMIAAAVVPLVGLSSLWPAWWLYHTVWKRSSKALAYTILVCLWIVLEWWYAMGDVSFPWLTLGGAFAPSPALVQWYSMTGAYGGTLWILLVNILIYTTLNKPRVWIWAACSVILPISISLAMYYTYQEPAGKSIAVAVIQPNIDPYTEKYETDGLDVVLPLAAQAPIETQLFVAPETAISGIVNVSQVSQDNNIRRIQAFLRSRANGARMIIGATTTDQERYYNSALMIDSSSVEHYHKSKLVMGVEVVPSWLMSVAQAIDLGGYVGSLGKQDHRTVFEPGVGSAICYESIYGEYFSQWAIRGAGLMTIITNDGWWGNTSGHVHHKDYARLRAIENRRAIVRSANTGISAIISPRGEVLESLGWDSRGIITSRVPIKQNITPYMQWGDMTARLALYVGALSLLFFVGKSFTHKN